MASEHLAGIFGVRGMSNRRPPAWGEEERAEIIRLAREQARSGDDDPAAGRGRGPERHRRRWLGLSPARTARQV